MKLNSIKIYAMSTWSKWLSPSAKHLLTVKRHPSDGGKEAYFLELMSVWQSNRTMNNDKHKYDIIHTYKVTIFKCHTKLVVHNNNGQKEHWNCFYIKT